MLRLVSCFVASLETRPEEDVRDPQYSIWANLWSLLIAFAIIVSLAILVLDSVQSLMMIPGWRQGLVLAGFVVLVIFALELGLLWLTMKDLGEFFSWPNFVNIIPVFPPMIVIFIRIIYDNQLNRDETGYSVLVLVQHLLVLRVFKLMELAKRSNKMTLILEAVKQSGDGIVSLFIADFILMVFFSTIIFYAEGSGMVLDNRPGSAFTTSNTVAALHRSKTFPSHSGSSLFR